MLKYKVQYNNIAKIGSKEYKFKPWNTKNEKDYLIAVESETEITDKKLFDLLIRPCLEDKDVVLSPNEQKMLIIEIRKKSIGATFSMRYACTDCKQVNDIDINFDMMVNFTPDEFKSVTTKDENNEDIIFNFGDIASERLRSKLDDTKNSVEYSFTEFLLHIQSIELQGELEDTFTFDELKDFIEELPTFIFDEVFKEFRKMKSTLNFNLKTNCMICNTENNIVFEKIPNFLWK